MLRKVWGVDSSIGVNKEILKCVENNFGYPDFWGRYLSTVEGVSKGLTKEEIQFLKS